MSALGRDRVRCHQGWAGERGSAVAEFAVAMPALVLVLAAALGGVQLGALQLRVQDAAADAARSLGRGDGAGTIGPHLARQAPGATWSSSTSGDLVCVRVAAVPVGPAAALGLIATASGCALRDAE